MAHLTLIDGTAYEISGGTTLVGGTGYEISRGNTLVDGTAYEIPFTTLCEIATQSGGSVGGYHNYAHINFVTSDGVPLYVEADGNAFEGYDQNGNFVGNNLAGTVLSGTVITCYVESGTTQKARVVVNGQIVAQIQRGSTVYEYTVVRNATIKLTVKSGLSAAYGIIEIAEE